MLYRKNKTILSILTIAAMTVLMSSLGVLTQSVLAQKNATTTSSASSTAANKTSNNFLTYQNPTYGVKIQYPSDWTVSQTGLRDYTNIVAFYSPLGNLSDTIPQQLLLSKTHYSQNIALNDYSKLVNDTLKQPGIQIVESKSIMLTGGASAHRVVFIPPAGNAPFKPEIMLVWTAKGDNIYTLSYNGDAAKYHIFLPTIEKMIDSFEITK
jgi:eukaryotic-like serine/threonine-protein kinase